MTHPERSARLRPWLLTWGLLGVNAALPLQAAPPSDVIATRHNLSVSGPGPIRALGETRVCVFCHTPHDAAPQSPLWNKDLKPQVYKVYTSPTLKSGPLSQPWGPTKLCLSCHDGTIALGAVLNPAGGISMAGGGKLPPGSLSNFGLDLSGHHPVSFAYNDALPDDALVTPPPASLPYGGTDEVHCTTCHDPHDDTNGRFLIKDNRNSALCITCHQMPGWSVSAHAISTASVVGILPRPPKTWPNYKQMNEWGCEVCHTPHFAPTAEELLNFTELLPDPFACTSSGCHSTQPPPPHVPPPLATTTRTGPFGAPTTTVDIARQVRKPSAHSQPLGAGAPGHGTRESMRSGIRSVTCADCHNPHLVTRRTAEAPYVPGTLQGVAGVDRNGVAIRSARYEYEVCFKCHADNTPDMTYVPRVVSVTNLRRAFDTGNPSYHPVVGMGRSLDVPSIPSRFEPAMGPSAMIYCTDCHSDDEGGSRGPHGSSYRPILRARYEMADGTSESFDNYALCYRCHDRSSILRDASFRSKIARKTPTGGGHSGHLAAGAPCSACHDPHGVADAGLAGSGSHAHLINFDTRIVLPAPGKRGPVFASTGPFSGSCTLVCHGVTHDSATYP